jgi:hypothetical protein
MPVHDWTRVDAGIFHAFHLAWAVHLCEALNGGVLPAEFDALPDQEAGTGGAGLPEPLDSSFYLQRQRSVIVRHGRDSHIVAMIEIVSPGNKSGEYPFRTFLKKLAAALREGVNLLVIDLFPPTPRGPRGLHSAFWEYLGGEPFTAPASELLMLAAYEASGSPTAFIEPTAVGRDLPDMPLILAPGQSVPVPLERTYRQAYDGMPAPSKAPLER